MPHELPYGVSAEGLGLRGAAFAMMPMALSAGGPAMGALRTRMAAPMSPSMSAPPPPPFEAAKKGAGGVMKAIGELFRRDRGAADEQGESPAEPERAAEKTPAPRTLRGKVKRLQKRQLVVEIELSEELDWAPGATPGATVDATVDATVEVTLADGSTLGAIVDAASTTRAGRIPGGRTVRLTLQLDAEAGAAPVRITLGGLVVEVQ
jgi:Ca-activated chloride channel family protein